MASLDGQPRARTGGLARRFLGTPCEVQEGRKGSREYWGLAPLLLSHPLMQHSSTCGLLRDLKTFFRSPVKVLVADTPWEPHHSQCF